MTYKQGGVEYLNSDEARAYRAVQQLGGASNTQVASATGMSRKLATGVLESLHAAGYVRDVSPPQVSSRCWQVTEKEARWRS